MYEDLGRRIYRRDPITSCFVPKCKSKLITSPGKHFFRVPDRNKEEWCVAVGKTKTPKGALYICEDHLIVEEDLLNYDDWKTKNVYGKLKTEVPNLRNISSSHIYDQSDSSLITDHEHSSGTKLTEPNVDKETSSAVYHCESCLKEIIAFRYVCLVCSQLEWCRDCEAGGGQHDDHYVLRVPTRRPLAEVKQVQSAVLEALTSLPVWKNIPGVNVARKTKTRKTTSTKKTNKPSNKLSDSGIDQRKSMNSPTETENEPKNSHEPVTIRQEEEDDNNEEEEVEVELVVKEEMDPLEDDAAGAFLQNIRKRQTNLDLQDTPSSQLAPPSRVNLTSQVFQISAPSQNSPLFLVAKSSPEPSVFCVTSPSHVVSPCQDGLLSQVAPPSQLAPPTKEIPPSKRSRINDHCFTASTHTHKAMQENKRSKET